MKKVYLVITEFSTRAVWIDRFYCLKSARRSFNENLERMCSRCQLVLQLGKTGSFAYYQVLDLYVRKY